MRQSESVVERLLVADGLPLPTPYSAAIFNIPLPARRSTRFSTFSIQRRLKNFQVS
jgi:hypothetical protein